MLIGYDASRAFVSEATGTENYSLNLLRALAKIDRKNRYRVYMRGSSQFTVHGSRFKKTVNSQLITDNFSWPRNFEFVQVRPHRLWTQVGLALETWRNPVDVLFVPAHTIPIFRRRKIWLMGKGKDAGMVRGFGEGVKTPNPKTLNKTGFLTYKPSTKYIVTIHDLGVEYLPNYHKFPQRYYLDLASKYASRSADAIIAVSGATSADLIKRYRVPAKKVFVVPEGVNTRFFKPQSQPKAGSPLAKISKVESVKNKYKIQGNYILAVGTVQPRKNLETLIRAFRGVCRYVGMWGGGDPTLVIVGKLGWDYQKILDLPKKLGIGDRVRFLGYVPREDLPALYTGASVFAAPSLFEGFDIPILEALACGCQVAASDISAHREIFEKVTGNWSLIPGKKEPATRNQPLGTNFEAGVLVKPKDIRAWSQFLYQYISLYNNRLTLASKRERIEAIRRVLRSQYSWEKTARETLKVFLRN